MIVQERPSHIRDGGNINIHKAIHHHGVLEPARGVNHHFRDLVRDLT